jgi:hypothetical protein
MAIDTTTPTSRRALIVGLAGGLAATVAGGMGRSPVARAADPNDVVLGASNSATSVTSITNTTDGDFTFACYASGLGIGVYGTSPSGLGVRGNSASGYGLYGESSSGTAVWGGSSSGTGVRGVSSSSTLPAVVGRSGFNTGVQGYSGSNSVPAGRAKTGVHGHADEDTASVGVRGTSLAGRGGVFRGATAPLRLVASPSATHPASGQRGDLFVDASGRLWFCKGGTTWKLLA